MPAPLAGFRIGITGDRRSEEQAELLLRRGAEVVHAPVMHTDLLTDADATLAATHAVLAAGIDVVVLTTGIGTRSWFGVAEVAGLDEDLREACGRAAVLARGPKARSVAGANGLEVAWAAPGETGAEVLERLSQMDLAGRRVAVQRDGGEPTLAAAIRSLGAEVVDVPVYRWHPPEDPTRAVRLLEAAVAGRLHALTFTCAYAVGSAFELASDPDALRAALGGPVVPVAVGPVTAAALRAHGIEQVVTPARARLGAMVQAAVRELSRRHRILTDGHVELRWQGDLLAGPDGTTAMLTAKEHEVLSVLLERAPGVVAKQALVSGTADAHAAEAVVGRLRAKLGPLAPALRTVPRRGYALHLTETSG